MRRPALADLAAGSFDLLVIGGGIIGCGVARDAALRGLRVALVEQDDFGSGTTSRSTRLIHGGLRYLELYDFGLVREDLRERETLLRIAPHLVRPLPFLVPIYGWSTFHRLRLRAGMLLYDLLSYDKSLPAHRFLSRDETLAAEPSLNPHRLQGAAHYFDAQVAFPERLCLENALDADGHGAVVRNYTRSVSYITDGPAVTGAEVCDTRSGETARVRAGLVVNATGAWLDRDLACIRTSEPPLLRTTKGVHLVASPLGPNAVVLVARSDRRVFFVVPWNGLSLIGTTDTDEPAPPDQVRADADDVGYLVEETRRAFPALADLEPYYSMAGVRALVRKEGVHESEVSRRHALIDHGAKGGPDGLVSIVGGKITGYRAIAEEAVELAGRKLGTVAKCTTARRPLPGASSSLAEVEREIASASTGLGLSQEQRRYLLAQYGARSRRVLGLAERRPELAERVSPSQPTLMAEVAHAAQEEAAVCLADVLLRRTPLGFAPGQALDVAPRVAEALGREHGWTEGQKADEIRRYRDLVTRLYALQPEPTH